MTRKSWLEAGVAAVSAAVVVSAYALLVAGPGARARTEPLGSPARDRALRAGHAPGTTEEAVPDPGEHERSEAIDRLDARASRIELALGDGGPDLPFLPASGAAPSEADLRELGAALDTLEAARNSSTDDVGARNLVRREAKGLQSKAEDAAVSLMVAYRSDVEALYGENPTTTEAVAEFRRRVEERRSRLAEDLTTFLPVEAARRIADALPPAKPLSTTDKGIPPGGR